MKPLEDRLSRVVEGGDSLAVDLAKGDLEREASERYKGFVVWSRLSRVTNKTVKRNAFAREEEFWRYPCRYIEFVNSQDGHVLRLNREIREAFRVHIWDTGVSHLFSRLSPPSGGGNGWLRGVGYEVWSPCYVEAGRPQ